MWDVHRAYRSIFDIERIEELELSRIRFGIDNQSHQPTLSLGG